MNDISNFSLTTITKSLRQGELSSREITQAFLSRIDNFEKDLHAFITITPDLALEQADQADHNYVSWRKQSKNSIPALLGVPIAIKDIISVANVRCTCGSNILENFVPSYNATSVQRLLDAGVVILGKTNTDEFAMGSSTENSAYGVTHNPWDLSRVPGGSSGGSASAVAARIVPAALGTDTGGSIRQPASFCGVTGLKPTYGRVSRYGLIAYGSSLDVIGTLTKDAKDAALLFSVFAGHDELDATSVNQPLPVLDLDNSIGKIFTGLRIGVPEEYFIEGIQSDVESQVMEAVKYFESLGAEIKNVRLPHTQYAVPVYYILAPAEASANLARYDGIRYGERIDADSIWDIFQKTRGEKFGQEVKRRIMLGTYALSAGYYDAYYSQAQKVRTLMRRDFELAFDEVDIIAAPVAPTTAFRIGEHGDDPLSMYLEDVFTLPANLAGIPGISFPVGFDRNGLPIGLQMMAPPFKEDMILKIANAYQHETDWHTRLPKGF
jgi:aspartyl-tRNA(Asn)/glutamyl-tRNA(Gln) amidotransferase subunit A